jgi:hypothetical protein
MKKQESVTDSCREGEGHHGDEQAYRHSSRLDSRRGEETEERSGQRADQDLVSNDQQRRSTNARSKLWKKIRVGDWANFALSLVCLVCSFFFVVVVLHMLILFFFRRPSRFCAKAVREFSED